MLQFDLHLHSFDLWKIDEDTLLLTKENKLLTPGATENKYRGFAQDKVINLTRKMFQGQGAVTVNDAWGLEYYNKVPQSRSMKNSLLTYIWPPPALPTETEQLPGSLSFFLFFKP